LPTRKSVIVVDDDPHVLKGIARMVKAHGFDVELFDSAQAFRDGANVGEALCLVLDINLDGESGIELRRNLAATGSSLPVIFVTADDTHATRVAAVESGCAAYLAKPFTGKTLIDAIEKAAALNGSIAGGAAQKADAA
jgi:FixJ family two-component response regulator